VFIMKGRKAHYLPNRVDHIFKMRGLWYVNVALQMRWLLMIDNTTR
jgi:hypothetical protein